MGRRTVEQTRSIDIRTLQRADYFCGPKDGSWTWRINGKIVGEARRLGRRTAHDPRPSH
jgi:hypothetical protein